MTTPSTNVPADAVLQDALAALFAARRLEEESFLSLRRTLPSSLLLWVHAWYPLPELVTWMAWVTWIAFVFVAVVLAVGAASRRARFDAVFPRMRRVVRLQFAPEKGWPEMSAVLLLAAAAASTLLWLNAVAPFLLSSAARSLSAKSWALLVSAAVLNKYFERS